MSWQPLIIIISFVIYLPPFTHKELDDARTQSIFQRGKVYRDFLLVFACASLKSFNKPRKKTDHISFMEEENKYFTVIHVPYKVTRTSLEVNIEGRIMRCRQALLNRFLPCVRVSPHTSSFYAPRAALQKNEFCVGLI